MKFGYLGAISTAIVVALGLILVIPAFTQHDTSNKVLSIMLSFNILDNGNTENGGIENNNNISSWCRELSSLLNKHEIKATIFVSGRIAEANPECVSSFSYNDNIDIGSETYNYVNLTSISDYMIALKEVQKGKRAVDEAGKMDSKLFRAPHDLTDGNIYSMLHRSGIVADFSYPDHYNTYENGQFVRYELKRIDNPSRSPEFFNGLLAADNNDLPVLLDFDNSRSIGEIQEFISDLKSHVTATATAPAYPYDVHIVNVSDLAGESLTIWEGNQS